MGTEQPAAPARSREEESDGDREDDNREDEDREDEDRNDDDRDPSPSPGGNGASSTDDGSSSDGENDDGSADSPSLDKPSPAGTDDKGAHDVSGRHLGNDLFAGTPAIDKVSFGSARSANKVLKQANGDIIITGPEGEDTLRGIECAVFSDGALGFDVDGTGGKAYRLYQAAFDRVPDEKGLGFWISAIENGAALEATAASFIASPEFAQRYGANLSNADFVDRLYANVMHRTADESGHRFWKEALDNGYSRADVLAKFSESPENKANVIGVLDDGFEYLPWTG